jgi:hypothetical protein
MCICWVGVGPNYPNSYPILDASSEAVNRYQWKVRTRKCTSKLIFVFFYQINFSQNKSSMRFSKKIIEVLHDNFLLKLEVIRVIIN